MTEDQINQIAERVAIRLKPMATTIASDIKKEYFIQACEEAVPRVLKKTFVQLGIDCSNPLEVQKDMAHLRYIRQDNESLTSKIRKVGMWGGFLVFLSYIGLDKIIR